MAGSVMKDEVLASLAFVYIPISHFANFKQMNMYLSRAYAKDIRLYLLTVYAKTVPLF